MGLLSNLIFIPAALLAFSCAVAFGVIVVIAAVITAILNLIRGEGRRLIANDPELAAAAARNRERA